MQSATFPIISERMVEMPTQPERIASLETIASVGKWVLGIFIPLVICWGAFITINVIAIKQKVADANNGNLVTELEKPKSPERLQAALSTVVAQAQTTIAENKKPDPVKVNLLSKAVINVIKENPQQPEVWRAASALINLRSANISVAQIPSNVAAKVGPPVSNQGSCFDAPRLPSKLPAMPKYLNNGLWILSDIWHDCTLDLGDIRAFWNSTLIRYAKEKVGTNTEYIRLDITLVRVNITYSGGEIIPLDRIVAYNRHTNFSVPSAPINKRDSALDGQDIMEAILRKASDDGTLLVDHTSG